MQIVSGGEDKTVRVWELCGKSWIMVSLLVGHTMAVNSVAFHPDGTKVRFYVFWLQYKNILYVLELQANNAWKSL